MTFVYNNNIIYHSMIVTLLCYTLNNISEISEIYNNWHVFTLNHLNIPTVNQLKYLAYY